MYKFGKLGDLVFSPPPIVPGLLLGELARQIPEVVVSDVQPNLPEVYIGDMRAYFVEKVAVVGYHDNGVLALIEEFLKPGD